jgi:hypothetical protein
MIEKAGIESEGGKSGKRWASAGVMHFHDCWQVIPVDSCAAAVLQALPHDFTRKKSYSGFQKCAQVLPFRPLWGAF